MNRKTQSLNTTLARLRSEASAREGSAKLEKRARILANKARKPIFVRLPKILADTLRNDSREEGKPLNSLIEAVLKTHCEQDAAIRSVAYFRVPEQTRGRKISKL